MSRSFSQVFRSRCGFRKIRWAEDGVLRDQPCFRLIPAEERFDPIRTAPVAATRGHDRKQQRGGDTINLDIEKRSIDIEIDAATLHDRLSKWKTPEPRYRSGVFAKYVALVGPASEGAVTC